jgi:hypothetical protein
MRLRLDRELRWLNNREPRTSAPLARHSIHDQEATNVTSTRDVSHTTESMWSAVGPARVAGSGVVSSRSPR